jgi:hypothetical protein
MFKSITVVALSSLLAATTTFAQENAQLLSLSPKVASSAKFRLPIIELKTANNTSSGVNVAQIVNQQILDQVLEHLDYAGIPMLTYGSTQYMMDNLATLANIAPNQGVQGLDYTVLYNKDNQIVLTLTFKHDDALAEKKNYEFAFDLTTGRKIAVTDIADLAELTNIDMFAPSQTGSLNNRLGMYTSVAKLPSSNTAFAKLNAAKHPKGVKANTVLATF